ncbi:uncharacterized protein PFL1_00049 [Pseudozyma flocculosa PF-1]|uniref:uncharacterized protein n=1 Tax=Pseudozyma flocculosa PF-1 TaxID=1277687 RepID=UPI000456194B|nr:uncharacterized protein PFL1_00049 [Pseudozyma flocculosa PF-1]EPQ31850.1 hypothetical protein PFL1_00049 [Pseudozyma flocculosa PF-1]
MAEQSKLCRWFGTAQGCRYGDSCIFKHADAAPKAAGSSTATPSASTKSKPYRPVLFSTRLTLNPPDITATTVPQLAEPTSDALMPRSDQDPDQTRSRLFVYLKPNFTFSSSFAVKTFCEILVSCNSKHTDWTMDKRTDFLDQLVHNEAAGIQRIRDVLRYPITIRACAPPRVELCFQQTVLLVTMFLSSEAVVRCMAKRTQTLLLGIVDLHLGEILDAVLTSSEALLKSSIGVPALASMAQIFKPTSVMLLEYIRLFKDAAIENEPALKSFVDKFAELHTAWADKVRAGTIRNDVLATLPVDQQSFALHVVGHWIRQLKDVVARAGRKIGPGDGATHVDADAVLAQQNLGQLAHMQRLFEGPGSLRGAGPRHDNDHADITKIQIVPTHSELSSSVAPYIPATIPGAPHHLSEGTYARVLDVQFRLLREEAMAPFRQGLASLLRDLQSLVKPNTGDREGLAGAARIRAILHEGGGRLQADRQDIVAADLVIHGDGRLQFRGCRTLANNGVVVDLSFCSPVRARSNPKRYWEFAAKRALGMGALVAFLVASGDLSPRLFMGTVCSFPSDMLKGVASGRDPTVSISFFDSAALAFFFDKPKGVTELLVEANGIIYDTIAPFLRSLQDSNPHYLPFKAYIAETMHRQLPAGSVEVAAPDYALAPGFKFDLSALLLDSKRSTQTLTMSMDAHSIDAARRQLEEASTFDGSQIDAIVNSLTSQVALIQGPPGTGKSYTGVALVDVLLKSKVRPILIVCVTNHALDHFLRSILDKGITESLVRFGSASKDPKVASFSWNSIKHAAHDDPSSRALNAAFKQYKVAEEKLNQCLRALQQTRLPLESITNVNGFAYGAHFEQLSDKSGKALPAAVSAFEQRWQVVGPNTKSHETLFDFWLEGGDLIFRVQPATAAVSAPALQRPTRREDAQPRRGALGMGHLHLNWGLLAVEEALAEDDSDKDAEARSESAQMTEEAQHTAAVPIDLHDEVQQEELVEAMSGLVLDESGTWPELRSADSDRDVEELGEDNDVWSFSLKERHKLARHWEQRARELENDRFDRAKREFEQAREELNHQKDQACLRIVLGCDIIGCTTNGAAKLTSLLANIRPKVLLVEEAAEILEAHVLASMTPSLQHLLLIGDPMQLRPHISNYTLSMESKRGQLHRLDFSLMERLATEAGLPITQLNVQRRMRAEIADLVRPLYHNLQDHPDMANRADVKGFQKNLVFMDHSHAEDRTRDAGSRSNDFEVLMVIDLVRYLCQLGYRKEGDICLLTPYLGQLAKLKKAMAKEVVKVVVDNRDEEQLALAEAADAAEAPNEAYMSVQSSSLEAAVRVATVDNFQGEEARVVILSLVRNAGSSDGDDEDPATAYQNVGIGFLKSPNRSNVALSRAKEGLFILGNAGLLSSKSEFWASTLATLDASGAVMNGFPLQCEHHPEETLSATDPGQIPVWAPNGGCPQICSKSIGCGHICDKKCHPGDAEHRLHPCEAPCARLHEECSHPCQKACHEDCGLCEFPLSSVQLPCGHTADKVPCHQVKSGYVRCTVPVTKELQTCEHTLAVPCGDDVADYSCNAACGKVMSCCGRVCSAGCDAYQSLSTKGKATGPSARMRDSEDGEHAEAVIERTAHRPHLCDQPFSSCPHKCSQRCEPDHKCGECREPCWRSCEHSQCRKRCNEPCTTCLAPCSWDACPHVAQGCPLPCGVPCSRLPCDARCTETLICGHPCPSLCGEPCDVQACIECMPAEKRQADVVDLLMHRTLAEIDDTDDGLDNILLTLDCGHIFTVETLDGILELDKYYDRDENGWVRPSLPSSMFEKPKKCPTCRAEIYARRYSRPIKRAVLDLQETKTTRELNAAVARVRKACASVDITAKKETLREDVAKAISVLPATVPSLEEQKRLTRSLVKDQARVDLKSGHTSITPSGKVFDIRSRGVDQALVRAWNAACTAIKQCYVQVQDIAKRPLSPSMDAWQAAVASSYQAAAMLYDMERDPRAGLKAMREAKVAVGTPAPRADYRFRVESIMHGINLRLLLLDLAEEVATQLKGADSPQLWSWNLYIDFVMTSIILDATKAVHFAEIGQCSKLFLEANALKLRVEFERVKTEAIRVLESELSKRPEVSKAAGQHVDILFEGSEAIVNSFVASATPELAAFYVANVQPTMRQLREEAVAFVQHLAAETFYQPVSSAEKMMITKAMHDAEFTHGGHWYRCDNGHPFTIGDCGGAMQVSACPECGARIGGSGHRLLGGNIVDSEMEDLAREQGTAPSPWNWAQWAP